MEPAAHLRSNELSTVSEGIERDDLVAAVARYLSDPAARVGADDLLARLSKDGPVLRVGGVWVVSRYAEICRLVGGGHVRSSPFAHGQVMPMSSSPTMATLLALMFPMMDGEDHRRLRGLSSFSFAPQRVARLRDEITSVVTQLWHDVVRQGRFDVVTDVAEILPPVVAAIQMGTPVSERDAARYWSAVAKRYHMNYALTPLEIEIAETELAQFAAYLDDLCEARRASPGDDLVSELVAAKDAGRLSQEELIAYVLNMYMNGVDTLSSGLTMAIWEILKRPEDRVRCGTDLEFAQAAFEEAVRLHSPVRFGSRFLNVDVDIEGNVLRQDDPVVLFYAAANRDASRYPRPAVFVPLRSERRHLGFGHGVHHCLGKQISVLSGAIVLQQMGQLTCHLECDASSDSLQWGEELAFCNLASLPVAASEIS